MNSYDRALTVLDELFARDYTFALATARDGAPNVRFVDTYWDGTGFVVVTNAKSQKAREIAANPEVALCNRNYRFRGRARDIGHPLDAQNQALRARLIEVFAPWYFAHNDEADPDMRYLRVEPTEGFFYKDGVGYQVDFVQRRAESFAFDFDIQPIT